MSEKKDNGSRSRLSAIPGASAPPGSNLATHAKHITDRPRTTRDPATRMQDRIFRDVSQWHSNYRSRVREQRQARSMKIAKLKPGDAPPAQVPDAKLGL